MDSRTPWRALVALGLTVVGMAVALVLAGAPRPAVPVAERRGAVVVADPLAVLHRWDVTRARAWADGDPAALRRLYVAGSSAGRADVRLLRAYLARGLVVRDLRMQVLAAHVVRSDRRTLRLVVTDRLASAVAVRAGQEARVPTTRTTSRTLVLRRERGRWRMASVVRSSDPRRSPPRPSS